MKLRDEHDIILRPVVTEKSTDEGEFSKYTFEVAAKATKIEVKQAVEKIFKKKVRSVNVRIVRGKRRRMGFRYGKTADWKKATVTLEPGEHIDFFEKA